MSVSWCLDDMCRHLWPAPSSWASSTTWSNGHVAIVTLLKCEHRGPLALCEAHMEQGKAPQPCEAKLKCAKEHHHLAWEFYKCQAFRFTLRHPWCYCQKKDNMTLTMQPVLASGPNGDGLALTLHPKLSLTSILLFLTSTMIRGPGSRN